MTDTTDATAAPCAALGDFLAGYTAWLWGCGATCSRIEKNVGRIAEVYGCRADLTIMPGHVTVALSSEATAASGIFTRRTPPCGINFSINAALSALSWNIRDKRISFSTAVGEFGRITSDRYTSGPRIALLTSLANAAFCRLFGGDAAAMAVVFAATLAGCFVKHTLLRLKADVRFVFMLCAFISSVLCAAVTLWSLTSTPQVAMATAVLYLIPGVPYLNAAGDLIGRHYLCAFTRCTDAVVLTAMLSAGLCAGLYLMNVDQLW